MKELIGRTITGLKVAKARQEALTFETLTGPVTYNTDADCCSETWFSDISGVNCLLGATILEVEEVPYTVVDDGRSRQDSDLLYGFKLKTTKGFVDIAFRNSSNGYYSGSLFSAEFANAPDMISITDDWRA